MFLELPEQLLEKWRTYFPIIQAYLVLRENRQDIPFASLLNEINRNDSEFHIPRKELSVWVKNAAVESLKIIEIDGSTNRKLCSFLQDEELFENCPICMEILNSDQVATCWNSCKKVFHDKCLLRWISDDGKSCPHCRNPNLLSI
jgi:hypothetical protein